MYRAIEISQNQNNYGLVSLKGYKNFLESESCFNWWSSNRPLEINFLETIDYRQLTDELRLQILIYYYLFFFLALEDEINSWPCFECSRGFSSSDELQKHLNEHENIAPPNGVIHNNNGSNGARSSSPLKSGKRIKVILPQKDGKMRHKCPICPRIFDRQYSMQRHVALHKGEDFLK